MIDPRKAGLVLEWCAWIDAQLAVPGESALVHGDTELGLIR
jgi:hypothetical protein